MNIVWLSKQFRFNPRITAFNMTSCLVTVLCGTLDRYTIQCLVSLYIEAQIGKHQRE